VVDDIFTTGSTLNECAKALLKAGASKVYGLCLSRAVLQQDSIIR
jgi:predicted amidophosphoribosyltransferase